jgi:hypothetical protein
VAKASKDTKKLLEEARERYPKTISCDEDNRTKAREDIKFVNVAGAMWDDATRKERGLRPCYEFDTLRISCKRIINDIRANRAQGNVSPTEDGDVETAETLEGLIRNIWAVSDGDSAVDNGAQFQVSGGYGAWRVKTKYADDSAWDQGIEVVPLHNPFCLSKDPASVDPFGRDARYWFVTTKINKEVYEQKYGKVPAVEFETEDEEGGLSETDDEDSVKIAEYWYQKPVTRELALLVDGRTVDLADYPASPEEISKKRTVQTNQICMAIVSGDKVLEGPTEWAGKYFPFIPVYGEHIVVDGKTEWYGAVRHSKDAARLNNYMLTLAAESAALAPQSKWWATPEQALGHTGEWARAHQENLPYLLANADPKMPGFPQRMSSGDVPAAFIGMAQISQDLVKATTGIFDASLGNRSNETAGVAIRQRQAEGQIATFNFSDNIAKGIRRTWEILVDLVPRIYDTERSVRILGADGAEKYVRVNQPGPDGKVVNDLSRGKFDVTVTVGPNFGTKRQEMAEMLGQVMSGNPEQMMVMGDLFYKSLDGPYADEMAERQRVMLAPPVKEMLAQKDKQGGKPLPPEAQAAMQQASQAMQMVEQQSQLVQAAAAEVDTNKAEAEKVAADLEVKAAKLQADYHRMMGDLAKKEAALILKEAQVQIQQTGSEQDAEGQRLEVESERQEINQQISAATQQIQSNAEAFMAAATQVLGQLATAAQKPESNKRIIVQRVNGALVGTVEVTE